MISIRSWEDTDKALARMGALQAKIAKAEEEYNKRIAGLHSESEELKAAIGGFALGHESDFTRRTKELVSGTIKLRTTTVLDIPYPTETLKKLKRRGMIEAIRVKENIHKPALKNLPDANLAQLGVSRRVSTEVTIKPTMRG